MTTDPDQVQALVAAVLAQLPEMGDADGADVAIEEIEAVASRLEEAHGVLVAALESVDRGVAGGSSELGR
jgi:hypothetical protein